MIQNNKNQNLNQNERYIHCRTSDITRILRTSLDRKNLSKELSKVKLIIFVDYIFPKKKKVSTVYFYCRPFLAK